ncbi:hypothetical protein J2S30_003080 [Herbaspirillum rubrisubalbicans]|uniref:hypothetical protein n=1 Tax=Herbaspirillum rubrisubalbicans TaxID=80842 RepID=UPI00209F4436|nr:hypothetical protein [Herbaspirillum rubrisubalbicans]MCP1574701.1 hypothetical protein [Herbaspirillum rubrisubalbicans]
MRDAVIGVRHVHFPAGGKTVSVREAVVLLDLLFVVPDYGLALVYEERSAKSCDGYSSFYGRHHHVSKIFDCIF